ncbi:MAG: Gfo/Idh/MocA family oxidoreductase [Chloroflexota bacterium]
MALRVGIVGTGFGARVQVPGFRAAGFEVTAICSADPARARAAAEQARIPAAVDTVAELVARDDVDVVCVASPPTLHHEHTIAALAAGKHVICEKPMARDTREAREMLAMAERAGLVHAIDHEFRYTPARSKVKELLAAHAIGEMRLALVMEMTGMLVDPAKPRQEWWLRRDQAGGLLGALGSHWIDSLIWWLGAVERVSSELGISAQTRPTIDGAPVQVTADDTAQLLLRMSSGAIATIQLSSAVHHPSRRVILYGSDGTIVLGGDGRVLLARGSGALDEILPASTMDGAFPDLARRVREHIEAGPTGSADAPHPTFADGLRVQAVMDAAYRSAEIGGAVAVAS